MIELENVSMTYPGGNQALKNVNINIEKGEFVFIVGSSGSGKTTLFRLLLKELDPTEGNITVAGYDYGKIKRKDIPKVRRRIGVVFQNFRLLKDRTIYENVAFAQRVIQTPARYIRRRVPAMLTLVGLADKYKSYPKELSGGEQHETIQSGNTEGRLGKIFLYPGYGIVGNRVAPKQISNASGQGESFSEHNTEKCICPCLLLGISAGKRKESRRYL